MRYAVKISYLSSKYIFYATKSETYSPPGQEG